MIYEKVAELTQALEQVRALKEDLAPSLKHQITTDLTTLKAQLEKQIEQSQENALEKLQSQIQEKTQEQSTLFNTLLAQKEQVVLQELTSKATEQINERTDELLHIQMQEQIQNLANALQEQLRGFDFLQKDDFKEALESALCQHLPQTLQSLPLGEYIEYDKIPLSKNLLKEALFQESLESLKDFSTEHIKEFVAKNAQKTIKEALLSQSKQIYHNVLSTHTFLTQIYQAKLRILSGDIYNTQEAMSKVIAQKSQNFYQQSTDKIQNITTEQNILVSK